MRIAFLNPNSGHAYDPQTPKVAPLAGAESAQLYLALAMADRGHDVILFTGSLGERWFDGVTCRPLPMDLTGYGHFDAILVTHHRRLSMANLRRAIGPKPVLLAWEHDCFRPSMPYVERVAEIGRGAAWIVAVSDWHRRWMIRTYPYLEPRLLVLRNAIAPEFCNLFAPDENIPAAKLDPPLLTYASAPRAGLERAIEAFRILRATRPDAHLRLHSSFEHYPPDDPLRRDQTQWQAVFDLARDTPGIAMPGTVPRPALARSLRETAILFYPNTIKETSSIACMEALAAGAIVLSHPNGAIPETLAGFGTLIPAPSGMDEVPEANRRFADAARELMGMFDRCDPTLQLRLRSQVDYMLANCTWSVRAAEAEALIDEARRRDDAVR
ncbi:MAG: glycosyltransferase family 4 protein [Alphaproteobacteria bacterium]|nr:glycosyltransferase family 4 protein [Alphaproteobacteria bacterium]